MSSFYKRCDEHNLTIGASNSVLTIDTGREIKTLHIQGSQGPSGANTAPIPTSNTVRVTSTSTVGSRQGISVRGSRCTSMSPEPPIGITVDPIVNAGDLATVTTLGIVSDAIWNFAINMPVYLDENGNPTTTKPISGYIKYIGYSLSPTSFYVRPSVTVAI